MGNASKDAQKMLKCSCFDCSHCNLTQTLNLYVCIKIMWISSFCLSNFFYASNVLTWESDPPLVVASYTEVEVWCTFFTDIPLSCKGKYKGYFALAEWAK